MSITAIDRSFQVVRHLNVHGQARFKDFAAILGPISHTALSLLLKSLTEIGEITRKGRMYHLAGNSVVLGGAGRSIYQLPPILLAQTQPILARTAEELNHSCAMFARVGVSTMKIMDEQNLPGEASQFSPLGYEWPLVPFHGFAQVFLAHGSEQLAKDCFYRWRPYLHPEAQVLSYRQFRARLDRIRRQGYSVEYKEEAGSILRVVAPVPLPQETALRFAVGLIARPVYLLELKHCVERLNETAKELADVLAGRVPPFQFDEKLPARRDSD